MSGTAAADWERDGGGFLRGLEREVRGLSVVGKSGEDLLKDLPPGFAEIFRGFGSNGQSR